tara:strand:- start:18823 stop:19275 length:453 start_codon:yes stop_codon:yes gene_type:complete
MAQIQITFPDLVAKIMHGLKQDIGKREEGLVHIFGPESYTTIDTRREPVKSVDFKTRKPTISCLSLWQGLPYGTNPIATIDALLLNKTTTGFTLMDQRIAAYIERTGLLNLDAQNRPLTYHRGKREYTIFTGAPLSTEGILMAREMPQAL